MDEMEQLGLMRIQIEEGAAHSVDEAVQLILEFLDGLGKSGDCRADRYGALLAGVDISIKEFAASFGKAGSPAVTQLIRKLRPKTFNGILKFSDLHRETIEEPEAEEEE